MTPADWAKWQRRFLRAAKLCINTGCGRVSMQHSRCDIHYAKANAAKQAHERRKRAL